MPAGQPSSSAWPPLRAGEGGGAPPAPPPHATLAVKPPHCAFAPEPNSKKPTPKDAASSSEGSLAARAASSVPFVDRDRVRVAPATVAEIE
jgi:hypothetical protein